MKYGLIILSLVIFTACGDGELTMGNKESAIILTLNTSIQNAIDENTEKFSQECMRDLGLCWYRLRKSANDTDLPRAIINVPDSSLSLQNVTAVTIVVDEKLGSNVENIDITLRGVPDNSTHEENRDFILGVIKNIQSFGWARYYLAEDPRIPGSQASKVNTPNNVLGYHVSSHPWLDPDYQISIDRRLEINAYNWYYYNDGTYLKLSAWRRDSRDSPMKTGTYLITLNFLSEREFWLSGITDETERSNWKELLPERLEHYHATRVSLEKKARAAGIEIDEAYQDPPIKALE